MKFTWHSGRRRTGSAGIEAQDRTERGATGAMKYGSTFKARSKTYPQVTLEIARISFGRRIELMRRIRELAAKAEFLEAGSTPKEKMEAALLEGEVERTYLEWGLTGVEGLMVDGQAATPESLIQSGPEALCREALALIKAECGLSEAERKN